MFRVLCSVDDIDEFDEPENFSDHIEDYISGGYSLEDVLDEEDFDFILNSMESTSKSFYRVEDRRFTSGRLKIGSRFSFKGKYGIRSFTRNLKVSYSMLDEMSDDYAGIINPVLFKTQGQLEHFNATPYAGNYTISNQEESLVGGTWQVLDVKQMKLANEIVNVYVIKQTNPYGTIR